VDKATLLGNLDPTFPAGASGWRAQLVPDTQRSYRDTLVLPYPLLPKKRLKPLIA